MSEQVDEQRQALLRAAELISAADGLVIAAGAGMGVDSGLPDFRGNEGFWTAYPALGMRGMDFTDIASPAAFRSDARLAWGFYGHRLNLYRRTAPHAGFGILRNWAAWMKHGAQVFTSNVDGQFQAAGFGDDQVLECHGSIHALQCLKRCHAGVWPAFGFNPVVDDGACRFIGEFPRCPRCGGPARPNVLMFEDWGWIDSRDGMRARLERWLSSISRPVVVEIGAGTAVPSVRHFTQTVLRNFSGKVVRINLRDAAVVPDQGIGLPLGALAALQEIDALLDSSSIAESSTRPTKIETPK